jgi:hypothetical protein
VTSQSPAGSDDPREIVDELEEKVSADTGAQASASEEEEDAQGDVAPEVPGSPEPSD